MKNTKINDLKFRQEEVFTTESLIRGILSRFNELGHRIGGFSVYTHSNVLQGSGMSSSAAFEVLIGTILNECFNDGKISAVDIAKIGQYAENVFFGKPCGLMDQTACSVGGLVTIDFKNPAEPVVKKVDFDFTKTGYALVITDTGGNHADLISSIQNKLFPLGDDIQFIPGHGPTSTFGQEKMHNPHLKIGKKYS